MFRFFKRKKADKEQKQQEAALTAEVEQTADEVAQAEDSDVLVSEEATVEHTIVAEELAATEPRLRTPAQPSDIRVDTSMFSEVHRSQTSTTPSEAAQQEAPAAQTTAVDSHDHTSSTAIIGDSTQVEAQHIGTTDAVDEHAVSTASTHEAATAPSSKMEVTSAVKTDSVAVGVEVMRAPELTTELVSEVAPEPAPEPKKKSSWLARLRSGLSRTGQAIGGVFVGVKVDEDLYEELETALIMADAGVEATEQLLEQLRATVRKERLSDAQQVKEALLKILTEHLKPLEKHFDLQSAKPVVTMIAGVNGAGKTTSIGKLAKAFQNQGASVLLAAGDTFRAAAREQLVEWGKRNNVTVIAQDGGDPAAVAFDAVNAGKARESGVVMVDTAGRLPTQLHLMEELKKIKRVITKAESSAPHEVLLVVDGNTGQNALSQIKAFDAAIGLTGLVVTKLDGTAKGGILAAVAAGGQGVRPVPVYWIGVGEGIDDLQPFVAAEFAAALLGQ